ncbi:IS66 family insertion sequence element accessory protein TnpB, partial [Vibrio campbellii]
WDKTGFALWYKRLEKAKYKWPTKERNEVFTLTQFELDRLLSGFTIIVHISGHSDQSFRDYPITHFGFNRSLIPRLSDHF